MQLIGQVFLLQLDSPASSAAFLDYAGELQELVSPLPSLQSSKLAVLTILATEIRNDLGAQAIGKHTSTEGCPYWSIRVRDTESSCCNYCAGILLRVSTCYCGILLQGNTQCEVQEHRCNNMCDAIIAREYYCTTTKLGPN
eukprot:3360470-Amphidinium_carterae.1